MMEMDSDEDALRKLAGGQSMDYSTWPLLLNHVIDRIEKIAHNDFPIPVLPAPPTRPPPPEPRLLAPLPSSDPLGPEQDKNQRENSPGSSQDTNKENANPNPAPQTRTPASLPPPVRDVTVVSRPEPQPLAPGELPLQIQAQLSEITSSLTQGFPTYPPHTIQRLAELVLRPREHYRSLPSYLHAVDRVVHVASGANIFPLPPAALEPAMITTLANGVLGITSPSPSTSSATSATATIHPGSDEHLGGALLTPIPWLARRAESVDGADAALSPESDVAEDAEEDTEAQHRQSNHHHTHSQHNHAGSGRPRHQQRLSTESTETIEGPNGVGHIETVSVSVNGLVPHRVGMVSSLGHGGVGSSSLASASHDVQHQQQGITQGELLREEQRAGVVPVSQLQRSRAALEAQAAAAGGPASANSSAPSTPTISADDPDGDQKMDDAVGDPDPQGAAAADSADADDDATPHARGPDEIGLADTGPQAAGVSIPAAGEAAPNVDVSHIDVEAAVGRPADDVVAGDASPAPSVSKRDAEDDGKIGDEPPAKKLREDQHGGDGPEKQVTWS